MRVVCKGTQRVHCGRCGSLLEYEWNDIYTWDEGRGDSTVTCPECNNLVPVSSSIDAPENTISGTYINNDPTIKGFDLFFRDSLCATNNSTISTINTEAISTSNKEI